MQPHGSTTWASKSSPAKASPQMKPDSLSSGLVPVEESGTCCFAKQDKVWIDGPDGAWEIYTVLEDADGFGEASAHAPSPRDLLTCDTAPQASARCCT